MMLQNLHTHTTFCDGKNTPEEMVQAAITLGMDSLGFSGHSPLIAPVPGDWCMQPEQVGDYCQEVLRLREKYEDKLTIFLGLEQDILSPTPKENYDYIIGSVHGLLMQCGELAPVDESEESFCRAVQDYFDGDALNFVEAYYQMVGQVAEQTSCQIVGHFDLICKFNEGGRLFDTAHPRYRKAALAALDRLVQQDVILEINTGAMSRGYRSAPYPEQWLLKEMKKRAIPICITSDTHSAQTLMHEFSLAAQLAQSCGYQEAMYLTKQGFVSGPLQL